MRIAVRNKAKYRYFSKPPAGNHMFTAGVGKTRSCVGQAAKATSTNYSADRQAPDAYEQGIDEGCGDEGKQEAVTETASSLVWFFDELKTL